MDKSSNVSLSLMTEMLVGLLSAKHYSSYLSFAHLFSPYIHFSVCGTCYFMPSKMGSVNISFHFFLTNRARSGSEPLHEVTKEKRQRKNPPRNQ